MHNVTARQVHHGFPGFPVLLAILPALLTGLAVRGVPAQVVSNPESVPTRPLVHPFVPV